MTIIPFPKKPPDSEARSGTVSLKALAKAVLERNRDLIGVGVVPECCRYGSPMWAEMNCQIDTIMIQTELTFIRAYGPCDWRSNDRKNALHLAVLKAIAEGRCDDPQACAAAAVETKKIEFGRGEA